MKVVLTIKKVLDMFAGCELVSHGNEKDKDSCKRERVVLKWSLHSEACPLQVATGVMHGYVFAAENMGLSCRDVLAVIDWADTGRWNISLFGKHPMGG